MKTHYDTLGVSSDASQDEIKAAYRNLAMKCHPDREGGDDKRFQELGEAYTCLSDPAARARYDNGETEPQGGVSEEMQIQQELLQHFRAAAETLPLWEDPIERIRMVLQSRKAEVFAHIETLEKQANTLEKFVDRLTEKQGIVTAAFASQIKLLRQKAKQVGQAAIFIAKCEKALEGYTFNCMVDPTPKAFDAYGLYDPVHKQSAKNIWKGGKF